MSKRIIVPAAHPSNKRRRPAWAAPSRPGAGAADRGRSALAPDTRYIVDLIELNSRACLLKLLLDLCRLVLVDAFLDRLGRPFDQVLGFLEAETGDGADLLDDVDLLVADCRQNDVELGLFSGRRGGCGGAPAGSSDRDRRGGRG